MPASIEEYLDRIAREAADYFDRGDRGAAISCVLSLLQSHPDTQSIGRTSSTLPLLLAGWEGGRDRFIETITGFQP